MEVLAGVEPAPLGLQPSALPLDYRTMVESRRFELRTICLQSSRSAVKS